MKTTILTAVCFLIAFALFAQQENNIKKETSNSKKTVVIEKISIPDTVTTSDSTRTEKQSMSLDRKAITNDRKQTQKSSETITKKSPANTRREPE